MELFVIVIAILILQVWGARNPLHQDGWYGTWLNYLNTFYLSTSASYFLIAALLPTLLVALIFWLLMKSSTWLVLPLEVLVLLYSFGRGEFGAIVQEYTSACFIDDWETGTERASRLGVQVDEVEPNNWKELHLQVLKEAAYRGFERMFAVLFWFYLFGPAGAFLYRIVFLFVQKNDAENPAAESTLKGLEWPVVRLLALSFTITGNFVGCYKACKRQLLSLHDEAKDILSNAILGALSVDEELPQTCEVTQKELKLLDRLYIRTLWFWLFCVALFTILV
ncbi:hypothetical protein TDB9533_00079 [Thalassocella blandensis]|nr:hypothetical protein TDB9533_00079 [Thalassocella blandensis]